MVLGFLKRRKDETPYTFYQSASEQSRQTVFFTHWGVPDTITGRFDMLIAHAILIFRRLKKVDEARQEEAAARSQQFSDLLFKDLDRALREIGVSDRKVPQRLKTLTSAFLGRGQAFGEALDAGDQAALADAIARNAGGVMFMADKDEAAGGAETADTKMLASYLTFADSELSKQNDDDVLVGQFAWPAPQITPGT